jgi:hypothetical protein
LKSARDRKIFNMDAGKKSREKRPREDDEEDGSDEAPEGITFPADSLKRSDEGGKDKTKKKKKKRKRSKEKDGGKSRVKA